MAIPHLGEKRLVQSARLELPLLSPQPEYQKKRVAAGNGHSGRAGEVGYTHVFVEACTRLVPLLGTRATSAVSAGQFKPSAGSSQPSSLSEVRATELRPSSKEDRDALVASGSLHHRLVIVERGKFGRKLSHRIWISNSPSRSRQTALPALGLGRRDGPDRQRRPHPQVPASEGVRRESRDTSARSGPNAMSSIEGIAGARGYAKPRSGTTQRQVVGGQGEQ